MLFALGVSVVHAQGVAPASPAAAFNPTRPVTLIVPFPPGGGTDAVGRAVAERLSQLWGQQMIVDNRAGAQGNVGSAQAARQPGDGYTVLLAHQGVFTVNPHLYKDSTLDPLRDFKPVTRATQQPFVLVAHPSLKAQSLAELVALARAEPGRISYGSSASCRRNAEVRSGHRSHPRPLQGRGSGGH
jgi:tripartite-type tricarboxylate transporter receptor subunit TctC